MNTSIFTRTRNAELRSCIGNPIAPVFRKHTQLIVMVSAMALVVASMSLPRAVQSVGPLFINAPINLTVTAASSTGISLSWTAPAGATFYRVERSESVSGPFMIIEGGTGITGTTFTDTTVTNLKAYVYRVRAIESGSFVFSAPSNMALGTAISFEFSQLQGQQIKAQHFHDVRTAINSVRAVANKPATNWSRPKLAGLEIKAIDMQELRDQLNEALTALDILIAPFTDPVLSTGANGTSLKAIHVEELQARSTRGRSNSSGPLYPSSSKSVAGEFGPIINLPLVPVHLSVLPDRRILFWGRDMVINQNGEVKQVGGHSEAFVWNMENGALLPVPNSTTNLFCSGHSFLPDGKLFVTGGHRSPHFDAAGEAHTNIFNYTNNSWTPGPQMNNGRWYPYNVTLGTGEPLIMAGAYWTNEPPAPFNPYDPNTPPTSRPTFATNFVPQVYTPGGGLRELAPPPDGRLTQYPYLHLTPDGKIFQAQSGFFSGAVEKQSRLLDPALNQWTDLQSTLLPHAMGTSVSFDDGKILLIGGFNTNFVPTNGAEFIDLNVAQPTWTQAASMSFVRAYHTATILPDGKVLVTGGVGCEGGNNIESFEGTSPRCSAGQIMIPELWDPSTGNWSKMAPHQEVRAYHSVAALLPDGRVLVGGGGLPGAVGEKDNNGTPITSTVQDHARLFGHKNVEIFSPPYLFDSSGNLAARPFITSAPSTVTYGETFFIGASGAGTQPKVSLVRLPSVTHGFNQDQRQVFLYNPVVAGNGINVSIPADSNKLPPGHYMLFILNTGVPSVSKIIKVQSN